MQSLKSCGRAIAGLIVWAIIVGVVVAVCQNVTGEPDPAGSSESPRPTATPRATPTPRPTSTPVPVPTTGEAAAKKCLSAWDGSHRETNDLIKADLISPDSFQHVETRYRTTLIRGGRILQIEVTFSSHNAFRARLRGVGVGDIDVQTCRAVAGGLIG